MAASNSPILGKYHALERLGAGAYGLVYRATEVSESSAQYAVKLERASEKKNDLLQNMKLTSC
ncbi:uncharacterized protein LACBIDRAFT_308840 [Laccaria bicolor S238N-H82]|uniref:Predicted protein n=1 Tax=Laccaria bicolor (strain S238N-H82 / ATCC MYA-4686) TaxID=486041 RepID=B0CXB6_LACBS|nr:uncharacterized protein LACBIDRAFT_308840 [Laccaria bicolor S238N-H82]EDR13228.1 predicted protein [Laccaria bicolor S238N-H82]|eukprot:XP_001875726.1 predicted protein [Laccaria bicolor S238N-H82]